MMRAATVLVAALVLFGTEVRGQDNVVTTVVLRPMVGLNIPLGEQRDFFRDSRMLGGQVAVGAGTNLQIVATLAWAFADHRFPSTSDRVDILQYDAGVEFGRSNAAGSYWLFRPFVGAGIGGRSYSYDDESLSGGTCLAGYAGAGSDLRIDRFGLRVEGRANVYCHKSPLAGGESHTRADAVILLGLAYHLR